MILNMGKPDRGSRALVVAPVAIVVALLVGADTLAGVILFFVAGIMLATAARGFCPTYIVLGISTHPSGLQRVGPRARGGQAWSKRRGHGRQEAVRR